MPTPEADGDNSDVEDEAEGIADESDEGSDTGDPDDLDSEVLADGSLSQRVKLAAYETGRLLALSEDYEMLEQTVNAGVERKCPGRERCTKGTRVR